MELARSNGNDWAQLGWNIAAAIPEAFTKRLGMLGFLGVCGASTDPRESRKDYFGVLAFFVSPSQG